MLRGSFSAAIRVLFLVFALVATNACSGDEEFILAYSVPPPGEVVAGDLWPEIHVQLADLRGDPQGTSGVVVTMWLADGNSRLLGTVSRATRGGVAVFNDITYTLAEDIEVTFTATGYRPAVTRTVTVVPNVPDHPRIVGEVLLSGEIDETGAGDASEPLFDDPNGDSVPIPAGELWPDFLVQIEDAFGNVVETSRDITLAVTDGSGQIQSGNDLFEGRTYLGRYIFDSRNAIFSTTAGIVNVTVLSGSLNPAPARPVEIIPDLPADLTFEQQPQNVSTDDRQVVTVAVRDQYNNIIRDPYPGNDLQVALRIDVDASAMSDAFFMVPNTMTMMLDPLPQLTVVAVDGIATFEVDDAIQINRPGLDFQLGTFAPSLPSAATTLDLSDEFDVEAGQPDNLDWVHPPEVSQIAGRRWNSTDTNPMTMNRYAVVVRVNDQFGNLCTNDFTTIVRLVASNNNPVNGGFQFNQRTAAGGTVDFGIDILQNLTYTTAETNIDVTAEAVPFSALVPVPDPVDAPNPITIVNNDASYQAFLTQPRSDGGPIVMGDPTNTSTDTQQTVEVQVFDAYGNLFVQDPDTMTTANVTLRIPAAFNVGGALLVRNDNPATLDTSIVVTATGGTATFAGTSAIQLSKKGIGYRLQADSSGLASVQSNFFDVVHGAPSSLNFIDEPESTHVDDQQQVQVEILDRFGNRATSSESPQRQVELVLQGGTMGASQQGLTTTNPINGIATFPDFQVDLVGTGYTIQSRSLVPTTLLTDTSSTFDLSNGLPARVDFTVQPAAVAPPARVGEDIQVQITYYDQFDNVAEFKLDGMTALDERAALLLVQGPSTGLCITGCSAAGADDALPNGRIDYLIQVDRPTDGVPSSDDYRFRILPSNPLIFTDTNSVGIDVAVGDPDHLAFVVPPRDFETAGIPWAPFIVEVQDIFDNRVFSANGDLIELQETPASSNFDDTIAVQQDTLVNGQATFNSIRHITAEVMTFDVVAPAGVGGTPVQAIDSPPATVTVEPDVPDNLTFENFGPALDDTNATTIAATSIVAGANWPNFEVSIRDAFGNRVDTNQVVTVSIDPTTGTGSLVGSVSVSAENGTARFIAGNPFFDDTVETPGQRISYQVAETVQLLANAGSVTQRVPSSEVLIRPASPDHLTFLDDPVDGTTDDVQAIRVVQEDTYGNVVYDLATLPTQQRNVTLAVLDAAMMPFGAVTITPSNTQMTVAGEVTYNVQVHTPGIAYGLRASTSGLVTSNTVTNGNTFDVINGGFTGLVVTTQPSVTAGTVDDTFDITVELQDGFGNRVCQNPNGTPLVSGPALELRLVQSPAGASCINGCGVSTSLGSAFFNPGTLACNPGDASWTFTGVTVDLPNDGIGGSGDEYRWEVRDLSGTPNVLTNPLPDLNAGTPVAFEVVSPTDPVEIAGEVWAPLTVRLVDQRGNPSGSDMIEVVPTAATGPLPGNLYPAHIGNPPVPPLQTIQGSTVVDSTASGSPQEATFNDLYATRAENMTFEVRAQTLGTVAPLVVDVRIDSAQLDHLTFINAAFGAVQTAGVPFVDGAAMPASFQVDLRDAFENRVISNRAITLKLTSGSQSAFTAANPGLLSVTANNGVATLPGVQHTVKETITVGATAGPVLSTTASNQIIQVEAAGPNNMFVSQQPTSPITADEINAGNQQIVIQLRDQFNNVVDGDVQGANPTADDGAVQLVVTGSGDSPYNGNFVSGTVTFTITDTTAGAFTMNSATSAIGGITNSPLAVNAFTVRNGVFSAISIDTQPNSAPVSVDSFFDVTFQIEDAFGNPITTGPSVGSELLLTQQSYTPVPPFVGGTCVEINGNPCTQAIAADAMGLVDFTNALVNRPGTYTFRAETTDASIVSANTNVVDRNTVGAPTQLVFDTEPDYEVTAGELWPTFVVEIQDQFGNPAGVADNIEIVFTAPSANPLTAGTQVVATTVGTSQAAFPDFYAQMAGDFIFNVEDMDDGGVATIDNVTVTVTPAEPDHLSFTNANLTPTFDAGEDFAAAIAEPGIEVQVRDPFDNPIPSSRLITLAVQSGSSTLRLFSNTAMQVGPEFADPTIGADGTATFSDVTYLVAEPVEVYAFSGPLQSNNIYDMTIQAAAPDHLAVSKVEWFDPMTSSAVVLNDLTNVPADLGRELNADDTLRITAQIQDANNNPVDDGG
ncbi:MAG: hypothetical protein KDH09_13275, partial [Chrysiogenetes bacterium]|nr:hypothetical protein [Chrysiogenetes bacterium]